MDLAKLKKLDIREYATGCGYEVDKRDRSILRLGDREKLVVFRNNGAYRYFNVHDEEDSGSLIDFVARRKHVSDGESIRIIGEWAGVAAETTLRALPDRIFDREVVKKQFRQFSDLMGRHEYLNGQRCIPEAVNQWWRFRGKIKIDQRYRSVIFPHIDQQGICGYEEKGPKWTAFAKHGAKGLWVSRCAKSDRHIVLSESAIDSISHAVLFEDQFARYASTCGALNGIQPELIRLAIQKLPRWDGGMVVWAGDADNAGRKLGNRIRDAFELAKRSDLAFIVHAPVGAKDWNDVLMARKKPPVPERNL